MNARIKGWGNDDECIADTQKTAPHEIDVELLVRQILEQHLISPDLYHHVCNGGGRIKMVDVWHENRHYKCRYEGVENWITPACKSCSGLYQKDSQLRNKEYLINQALKNFADAVINEFATEPAEKNT